ncbi:MAG: oxidoreductase [Verrucomicrobiae bacterium]|nr:oxidoreductase [Verrucomicrobiae bacterium]
MLREPTRTSGRHGSNGAATPKRDSFVRSTSIQFPGIDLAGTVKSSSDSRFVPGDSVLVNGWGLGEDRWGGLSQKTRVPGDFVIKIPKNLTNADAMAIGTAGYTAALSLATLERAGLKPKHGKILVTGANGGVGSIAIALLAACGYQVTASTGRPNNEPYLRSLGASEIIDRNELATTGKPLQKERWAAAIDSLGGTTLANICASAQYRGLVAACGLAQSMDFPATMAPFILRNITVFGIDSVRAPRAEREEAWQRLSQKLDRSKLGKIKRTIPLNQVPDEAKKLLEGKIRGRLVVNL